MKNIFKLLLSFLLLHISCGDRGYEEITYYIENTTNHDIKLLFYDKAENGDLTLKSTSELNGKGVIWQKTVGSWPNDLPPPIFEGNFVVIVFDNALKEEHHDAPGNSILNYPAIYGRNNNRTYSINESNYDNAIPCDGPCY